MEIFAAVTADREVPVIQARMGDGYLMVSANGPVSHRTDTGAGGLAGALGRWAVEFAARAGRAGTLRAIPPVWCSWYQYYADVTDEDILANLAAMRDKAVPVGIVQIDDGYEAAPGDWLLSSGQFADLPSLVDRIRAAGRRAGLWLAPMLVGRDSELLRNHPGWVVRDAGGEPVFAGTVCRQRCTVLDVTHPDAADYLSSVLRTMRDWGIDYFKIDFCYAGAREGRRHEDVTGIQAYRRGLELIRAAIGPEPLLLGCGAPILPSVGLVDAMRVGPDIAARYDPPDGNPVAALAARRVPQHGSPGLAAGPVLGERPGQPDGPARGGAPRGMGRGGRAVRRAAVFRGRAALAGRVGPGDDPAVAGALADRSPPIALLSFAGQPVFGYTA